MTLADDAAASELPEPLPDTAGGHAPDPVSTLEFCLHPDDLAVLTRLPVLVRSAPSQSVWLLWHDDHAQSLAAGRIGLLQAGSSWQVDRLKPDGHHDWPACCPPPMLGRAADPADLPLSIPSHITPVAAFNGRSRAYRASDVAVTVLHGTVRGVVEVRPACRLVASGPASSLAELLRTLVSLRLSVPRASLACEALAAARGTLAPARHLGAPALGGEISVGDGLAAILGHLLDVLLFWTDRFRAEREPEAIHQARVATRRLRSALSIYNPVASCPELADAASAVKHCATILGAARDWDVFLASTGAHLAEASNYDPRTAPLLRAASRRRHAAYADLTEYLDGPQFRHLELSLGAATALRPWERIERAAPVLQDPTSAFALTVLTKCLKRVRRRGRAIDTLPIVALHELRKDCKRLRYAAEFFAPGFAAKPGKLYLRHLGALQEALGAFNDAAAAGELTTQLGRAGRGYAAGMIDGMAAAAALTARADIVRRWKRFKRADPFWK